MQPPGGGREDFFGSGNPFAGFGGMGGPHGSLMSSFLGGRDPFNDPFFTRPLGSMIGPSMFGSSMIGPSMFGSSMMGPSMFGSSMMGPSMFGSSMFGAGDSFVGGTSNAGFPQDQVPQPNKSNGPIIQELSSDDESGEDGDKNVKEKEGNPRKHSRSSKEPYIQEPDEETEGKKTKHMQYGNEYNRATMMQPQSHSYTFQSSTVTYGGPDGPYYTSSTTRKAGGDGVIVEESKEADTTTRKATHRISRGIRDKGHSFTRKLNSDGRVDTLQTLHNLNEDELSGFEETWNGKAKQHLPGWNQGLEMLDNGNMRGSSSRQNEQPRRGWALPSTEQPHNSGRMRSRTQSNSSNGRP